MTRASWRTMACLLAVGIGGLVVWADDPPAAPKAAKSGDAPKTIEREVVPTASATPPPAPAAVAPDPVPPPLLAMEPKKDDVPPPPVPVVSAPQVIVPSPAPIMMAPKKDEPPPPPTPILVEPSKAAAAEPPPPPSIQVVPPLPPAPAFTPPAPAVAPPPAPPCADKACFDKPEIVRAEPDPPTRLLTPPPPPPAMIPPPPPMTPLPPPAVNPPPILNVTRTSVPPAPSAMPSAAVTPAPHTMSPFPWKVCLEFVSGQTQVELRRGDEMLLRVQCEKLDLSTPAAGLTAVGKVVVSGPCLEARCEKISIAWNSGQVALDGSVYLSFQNKGVVQVMRAESLCFRLTGASVPVEFTARDVHQMVGAKQ